MLTLQFLKRLNCRHWTLKLSRHLRRRLARARTRAHRGEEMRMKMKRWSMKKRKMMRTDLCDHHKRCKQVMKHYGNGRVWTMIKVEPRFKNIGSSTPEDTKKTEDSQDFGPKQRGVLPPRISFQACKESDGWYSRKFRTSIYGAL